jgi:2-dehydropantoate 2-reductase
MKVAVVGAGGIGGYFGGLLATGGHEVTFIARGEHLRAIRSRGLEVRSPHSSFTIAPARATDRPAEVGAVDLVLFAVKTYDSDAAIEQMRPLVGAGTAVLTLQNGVESTQLLSRAFGAEQVIGGAVWIVSALAAPGVVQQESQLRRIVLGELDGRETPRVQAIRDALAQSGTAVEISAGIRKVLWTKLLFLASLAGLSSVTRAPVGPLMAVPEARDLLERAMREVEAVARAQGIDLAPDAVPQAMALVASWEPGVTTSMQRDAASGRRLEHDALSGAVVRAGRAAGVATPAHEFFWTCLKVVDSMAAPAIPPAAREQTV